MPKGVRTFCLKGVRPFCLKGVRPFRLKGCDPLYYLCIRGNNQRIIDGLHPERASHAEESIRPCKYHAKEKKRQEGWLNIIKNIRGILNGTGHAKAARCEAGLFPAPAGTLLRLPGRTGLPTGLPPSFSSLNNRQHTEYRHKPMRHIGDE